MFTIRSCSTIYILILLFASIQFTWSIAPQYHEDIYPKTSLSNNDGGNEEHDGKQVYQPSLNTTSDPMTQRTQSQLPLNTLEPSTKQMTKRTSATSSSKLLAWDTDSSSNSSHRRLLFRTSRDQPYVISDNTINVTMGNASGITQSDKSLLSQALGLTNNSSDPSIRENRSRRQVECWRRGFCREPCIHGRCFNDDQSDSKEGNPHMNLNMNSRAKRRQQVNPYINRGQQANPYNNRDQWVNPRVNRDQPVSKNVNWGREMNRYTNRDQPVKPNVNQDQQVNQNTNWKPRVNPTINRDQPVKPNVNQDQQVNQNTNRKPRVNPTINRDQPVKPNVNQDQQVNQNTNWKPRVNPTINRDQPVKPNVNQDQQVNQNTNWKPRVNPTINRDQPVKPNVNLNPAMSPHVNRHQQVNPHINRHQQVNPHINQGQQMSPNVNQTSPVNPDENITLNSNPVGSTNIGGKGGDGVVIINVFGGNGGKGGSTFTIRGQ